MLVSKKIRPQLVPLRKVQIGHLIAVCDKNNHAFLKTLKSLEQIRGGLFQDGAELDNKNNKIHSQKGASKPLLDALILVIRARSIDNVQRADT